MLTFVYQFENAAYVLNSNYELHKAVKFDDVDLELNMHDLNFLDSGRRVLAQHNNLQMAPASMMEDVDYGGECQIRFTGFQDLDAETMQLIFTWNPMRHISLKESQMIRAVGIDCERGLWDPL